MFGCKGVNNSLESTGTWTEHIVANRLGHSRAGDFSLQEIERYRFFCKYPKRDEYGKFNTVI